MGVMITERSGYAMRHVAGRLARRAATATLCATLLGGCFSPNDGGGGNGGASGEAGSGGSGGATGGTGGTGATGGTAGFTGGAGGVAGGTGGFPGTGGFGGEGGGIGGVGGSAGIAGTGGSPGECMVEGDCHLVSDQCCACPPAKLGDVRAVPFSSMDFGADCSGVLCGPCLETTEPIGVVADCVDTTCTAVNLAEQAYTACKTDSDCMLVPASCCGFCGTATLENAFALSVGTAFNPCSRPLPCPAIACPPTDFKVVAFCEPSGHCSVRNK
jgi:hypothetical protein